MSACKWTRTVRPTLSKGQLYLLCIYDPIILLRAIHEGTVYIYAPNDMYQNVHSSVTHDGPDLKTAQVPISRINNEIMGYPHKGLLYLNEELATAISDMDESHNEDAE